MRFSYSIVQAKEQRPFFQSQECCQQDRFGFRINMNIDLKKEQQATLARPAASIQSVVNCEEIETG